MNRKMAVTIAIAVALVLGVTASAFLLVPRASPAQPEPLSISLPPSESSALVYIADSKGYFAENGLAVTVKYYEPPAAGVRGMMDGEVDLAGSSEYAVVLNAFAGANLSIIVKADDVRSVYLIARKDRGIANISDLAGKTIGLPRGTNAEFFLGRFLTLHGLRMQDVTLADVQPAQFAGALENGSVDALICWEPYAGMIRNRMGDGVAAWPAQAGQPTYGVIVARDDWIRKNPGTAARFLKALDAAAAYTGSDPAGSRAIVQGKANLSTAYMDAMWPENRFSLSLDQSLVLAMEDESRWMIANNLTNATAVPDFAKYIYPDALEKIKPGSVNIIR